MDHASSHHAKVHHQVLLQAADTACSKHHWEQSTHQCSHKIETAMPTMASLKLKSLQMKSRKRSKRLSSVGVGATKCQNGHAAK